MSQAHINAFPRIFHDSLENFNVFYGKGEERTCPILIFIVIVRLFLTEYPRFLNTEYAIYMVNAGLLQEPPLRKADLDSHGTRTEFFRSKPFDVQDVIFFRFLVYYFFFIVILLRYLFQGIHFQIVHFLLFFVHFILKIRNLQIQSYGDSVENLQSCILFKDIDKYLHIVILIHSHILSSSVVSGG